MPTQSIVRERPVLFSAPMVRAILEGRKTQTRRVVKPQPSSTMTDAVLYLDHATWCFTGPQRDGAANPLPLDQWKGGWPDCGPDFTCPYGVPGDRLWVRETWLAARWGSYEAMDRHEKYIKDTCIQFAADPVHGYGQCWDDYKGNWRPSIFMPRWASRITLELTDVRVQRLQEISEADAKAEGALGGCAVCVDSESAECLECAPTCAEAFANIWIGINGEASWRANPWVWALTFRRLA